eukprot:scaffold2731_cov128-Isochrysis_galbana.AAC.2
MHDHNNGTFTYPARAASPTGSVHRLGPESGSVGSPALWRFDPLPPPTSEPPSLSNLSASLSLSLSLLSILVVPTLAPLSFLACAGGLRQVMGGAATPEGVFCCTHNPCQSRSSGQCSGCASRKDGKADG